MNPFFILVALIGGDCDDDRPMCTAADGLEDMDCPHDIGCVGFDGLVIGKTNNLTSLDGLIISSGTSVI